MIIKYFLLSFLQQIFRFLCAASLPPTRSTMLGYELPYRPHPRRFRKMNRLFISDRCARGTCQRKPFRTSEPCLVCPPVKIIESKIKTALGLYQHVERHHKPESIF